MVRQDANSSSTATGRLLARLPPSELRRLSPALERVALELHQVIQEERSPFRFVYFPVNGVVSAINVSIEGESIEVATIGNEGMVGLPAFVGSDVAATRMLIQVGGEALRMTVEDLRAETTQDTPLKRLLVRYHAAFLHQISQAVLCNGLHSVKKRCCKWLLMTHDRIVGDEFPMTHEFMSEMLGVRRATVTELLNTLDEEGVIRNHTKRIFVQDRARLEVLACECYRSFREEYENW